jgi:hypothetical protein
MARERNRARRGFGAVAEPSANGKPEAVTAPTDPNGTPDPPPTGGADPTSNTSADDHGPTYFVDDAGGLAVITQRYDPSAKGWVAERPKRLTNFSARITGNRVEDDDAERSLFLSVVATLNGRTVSVPRLPAGEFSPLSWAIEKLGGGAIIYPGREVKDLARTAIQTLSGDIPTETVFTHLLITAQRRSSCLGSKMGHGNIGFHPKRLA